MTYTHLFAPPKPEDFDYEPDPMGRLGMGRQVERRDPDDDPGWDLARADWMQDAPLTKIVGETPFGLFGSVGRDKQNRRGDVFKLQALLHREGHLDAEATGGPTGYWGNRDDDALRAFQKGNGLTIDGYADPNGETIGKLKDFLHAKSGDRGSQQRRRHAAGPACRPGAIRSGTGRTETLVPPSLSP